MKETRYLLLVTLLLALVLYPARAEAASWTSQTSGTDQTLNAVTYGEGRFVAVGEGGTILVSDDRGDTWTRVHSYYYNHYFYGVAYGDGTYVVVGFNSVWVSSDNWQTATRVYTDVDGLLSDIAYGNGRFVAPGTYGVWASEDGFTWEEVDAGTSLALYKIIYADGKFVAVGQWGTVRVSRDGVTWTAPDSGTGSSLRGIGYGDNVAVLCTDAQRPSPNPGKLAGLPRWDLDVVGQVGDRDKRGRTTLTRMSVATAGGTASTASYSTTAGTVTVTATEARP